MASGWIGWFSGTAAAADNDDDERAIHVIQSLLLESWFLYPLGLCVFFFFQMHTAHVQIPSRLDRHAHVQTPAADRMHASYLWLNVCMCVCAHIRSLHSLPCVVYKFCWRKKHTHFILFAFDFVSFNDSFISRFVSLPFFHIQFESIFKRTRTTLEMDKRNSG